MFGLILAIHFVSGLKNAAYYSDKNNKLWLSYFYIIIMSILILIYGFILTKDIKTLFFFCPIIGLVFMWNVFLKKRTDRVHAMENAIMYCFGLVAFLCGANLIDLILSFLAGNVLFNIPIQYGATGKIINSKTPAFEKIEIDGLTLYKPRISNGYIMLCIGLLSVIIHFLHFNITINDIWHVS